METESGTPLNHSPSHAEVVLEGNGVAPGVAIGPAFLYTRKPPRVESREINPEEVEGELDLLDQALARAEQELTTVVTLAREKLGAEDVRIFEAQQMMLRDEELLGRVRNRIRNQHETAGYAVQAVIQDHQDRLNESDNEYLRERTDDLGEIRDRILRALRRGKLAASIEPDSIIVAESLSAADVVRFSKQGVLGFVTNHGGATSHVSIVARALGIPALVSSREATEHVSDHDTVVLDGRDGTFVVHPSAETLDAYRDRRARHQAQVEEQNKLAKLPCETLDGHRITLRANVEFGEELDLLDRYGARGIGLLRTEMLFLMRLNSTLSEPEQVVSYREAAEAAGEDGVTVRLLDLGGDKVLPLSHREQNPFLGWRGIRVLLDRPEILRPQVRALLRANASGTVRLLVPMITHLDEVERVQEIIREETEYLREKGIEHDPDLPVGIMVEVPAVALRANLFAEAVDFFAIGTNDLTQYVLAVDRGNDLVAQRFDSLHPAVLRLVKHTATAAADAGIPVSVCGEVASDAQATAILIGLGVTQLSASPTYLPAIKRVVRSTRLADARALADEALAAPDAEAVRRAARTWLHETVGPHNAG